MSIYYELRLSGNLKLPKDKSTAVKLASWFRDVRDDNIEEDEDGKITLDTYMSDGRNMVNIDNPVFIDLIGSVYSATSKWFGAVLAPNGKIYCAPYEATQVLEIDPFPKSTDFQKYLLLPENIVI